ncbi:MAG: hypothetical protein K2K02_11300 [Ruminococcus sp.]|nr:hypothetical protein [Ruminococcus sp.]
MSDKLKGNTEIQYKIIVTIIEFEKEISGFINDMKLDEELPQIVLISKRKFININNRLISHLEKISFRTVVLKI